MYEFKDGDLRKLQLKSLEILIDFKEFCDKNGLTFFLCGGCCIGAIREGGFLKWDDDADIFMPREDYERLHEIWRDTEKYTLLRTDCDTYCAQYNTTFMDKTTTCLLDWQVGLSTPAGVAIDILPLDGCPTGFARKMQKLNAMLFCLFNYNAPPANHGKMLNLACRILLGIVPSRKLRYKIWRGCERRMSKYKISDCNKITELCSGTHYMQLEYPKELFASAVLKDFENVKMPVPVGYDEYLTMAFGDYMTPPPDDQKTGHHHIVDLKL